ncbi:hypothetical protein CPLU01_12453 [Colletotrichum plurivorum]|uniref:Retroviral polymerase SH3-like domain-containing protein n=1 Tax=Colletotrichum plurivorum TaxID=2175906 RepID=A0A8H6JZX1_9PEZI|nr:hypothetical protein CPLU01_12453 [Colletotrichum plurivorum]
MAAVYIANRSYTAAVGAKTPIQALLDDLKLGGDHTPDISQLRVLGSTCFVHIPVETRVRSEKLAARARKGILIGYEGDRIYRIWLPDDEEVVRSPIVVFHEPEDDYEVCKARSLPPGQGPRARWQGGAREELQSLSLTLGIRDEEEVLQKSPRYTVMATTLPRSAKSPQDATEGPLWTHPSPSSAEEARNGAANDWLEWREAAFAEIHELVRKGVLRFVDKTEAPRGVRLTAKWVFKYKCPNCRLERRKARVDARGFLQVYGRDFIETYASTARTASCCCCCCCCCI